MDTINRLQFRHHEEIFEDRCKAIEYIYDKIKENGVGLASEQNSPYGYSLFAEPTILRYENKDDDAHECEENGGDDSCNSAFKKGPHIMLVIGSETNNTLYHGQNRFCIIDIDKTEAEIKDLEEELAKAIKSLTLAVFDSSTLDLTVEKTEDGTFLSGDVKTAKTHVFDGMVKENNMMIVPFDDEAGPEGLFIYVDLTYDEASESFMFVVSQADGTLKKTSVKLPNNYLVSGEYKKQDESLHLHMKNGDEVVINCEELIAEWNVEGEASKTPIVLTKEEVDYDGTDEHHHVEPWQDVLRADVRIADDRPANILKKTTDGRYLYVDGVASNIVYYWNGDRSNVKEQLDKLNKIKISHDNDNIIWERADGYFASTKLDYISSENKLIFTTSSVNGTPIKHEVQLNSFDIIESITYDPTREELVIKYKNDKGETKTVRVPISGMIDEWEVLNTAHSVKLVKQRKTSGKDILTADVNISSLEDNIIEETSEQGLHTLYVKGTADNIKYGDGTVKDALDSINEKNNEQDAILEEHQSEIEAISADSLSSLKDIINNDHSIDIDKEDPTKPVISVNISEHEPYNTIRLEGDGLYNFIDLKYDSDTNKLTFIRSDKNSMENVEKEIQLNSAPFDIRYDKNREVLIITYHTSEGDKTVEIDLHDLIHDEWTVEETETVILNKTNVISGGPDVLTANVKVCHEEDNAIEIHNDGLYSHDYSGEISDLDSRINELGDNLSAEIERSTSVDSELDSKISNETIRAISAETSLNNSINTVNTNLENEVERAVAAETRIETKLDNEITRATAEDQRLYQLIVDEQIRATNADEVLDGKINDEIVARTEADSALQISINNESAARDAEDRIINTKLQSEIDRSTAEDERLNNLIIAEKERAEAAEDALDEKIDAATLTFEDTTSINFNDPPHENNVVKADVKIANATDNMILIDASKDGVYASAHLSYVKGTNTLTFTTSAGIIEEFQLAGATVIDQLYYDNESGELVIVYHDGTGTVQTVRFPVSELFNEWIVQNPSEKSAVELTKTRATEQGQPDELKARVLITDDHDGDGKPDQGSDNMIEIRNNGLYVCGSGNTVAECVSGKTDAIYKTLFGGEVAPGGCGEGIRYTADPLSCVISGATSFMDADKMMARQICEILEMWVSGETCTTKSDWIDDGANKKMMVDVKLSRGNTGTMTDDEIVIENLNGDYIDPTGTEFTDTNALRIVCLQEGSGGVKPAVDTPQNGIYLSNAWDCGMYYGPDDTEAKAAAEAAGYKTDYYTDEDSSASNYNYMNNVRQHDI